MIKRIFDITLCLILFPFVLPFFLVVSFCVLLEDGCPVFFWSERVGKNNQNFMMPKFRSMKKETPAVATHLLSNSENYLLKIGKVIRKFSLDEIPQLFSVLKGDMSFVGPRPALFNQDDLILLRTQKDVHCLLPGITGWAQINGRDSISIAQKVDLDHYYMKNQSFLFDLKILFLTGWKVLRKIDVSH